LPGGAKPSAFEGATARAIEGAFRELIEHRYLYQKLIVDLRPVDEAVKEAIKDATIRAITPGAAAGGGLISRPIPPTEKKAERTPY
jgi:hypothetical protein